MAGPLWVCSESVEGVRRFPGFHGVCEMYSVVLLVALSGSADVVELGGHKSCKGCSGAVVVEKASCNGCCGGHKLFDRSSKSCNGCCGGHKLFDRSSKSCNGCNGGHKLFNRSSKSCSGCNGCTGGSAAPMAEPKKEDKKVEPKKAA